MVKLTNKKEGNKHQQDSELRQRSLTEADQKHKPKIMPSKGGRGEKQRTNPNAIKRLTT